MNTPDEVAIRNLIKTVFIQAQKGGGYTKETEDYFLEEYAKAYAPVPSNEDYEGAGKILYPLVLQEIILDYKAWLESIKYYVKKSIHPQINEKIKSLDKYKFDAPVPWKEEVPADIGLLILCIDEFLDDLHPIKHHNVYRKYKRLIENG